MRRRQTKLLGFLFFAALMVGMILATRFAGDGNPPSVSNAQVNTGTASTAQRAGEAQRRYEPEFRWLPVLAVGTLALGTVAYFSARSRLRRRAGLETSDEELVGELAALIDDTLDDLRAEPDPRRAVIAAYARMERALAGYGLPRRAFEAPLEYLDRVAGDLHGRLPSARRLVFELTHLFERAKFSPHAIAQEMKDDAIATLSALRDELREVGE